MNLAMLCLYTRLFGACRRTWTGFSMKAFAFKELCQFAELAVPSAMMVCLEWWSFELLVLLSGLSPNPKLQTFVLSICLNTGALMFTVPSGLCAAISTAAFNELGAVGLPAAPGSIPPKSRSARRQLFLLTRILDH
ncbi:hypothetical protein ZWY2020_046437 [Hordeum vulgare]|nr:hypothetical protein ZWY2020_046437 [Hordeum vulgare]